MTTHTINHGGFGSRGEDTTTNGLRLCQTHIS